MCLLFCVTYCLHSQTLETKIASTSAQIASLKAAHDSLSGTLEELKFQSMRHQLTQVGLPEIASCDEVVYHMAYALVYDELHEQAKWVAHMILPEVGTGTEGRTNDFRPDPQIKSGSAVDEDYARKIKTPEGKSKTEGLKKLQEGVNKVSIPNYYFKVILDIERGEAIGFIMPNSKCEYQLNHYVCSVDSVEKITGINFFHKLADEAEHSLESVYHIDYWLPESKKSGDVEPLDATKLARNTFNTTQAALYAGKRDEITVCGKVVSSKLSAKGNVFLNLDKMFPNHIFTVTIFSQNVPNFSYQPHEALKEKTICVTGFVTKDSNGVPGIIIENESAIEVYDE